MWCFRRSARRSSSPASAMLLSILIGLPLGIWAAASRLALRQTIGQLVREPRAGTAAVLERADARHAVRLWFPILPTSGYGEFRHYVLPALTLAISTSSAIAGLTAANMAEALKSDFIQLERVLGLSESTILLKHALRNAALPIVTYLGLQFGLILGGAIVTERVFAWPGIGQRIVEAILGRDYPVVQAVVLVTALMFMLINLLVDILYMVLDPRLRHERRRKRNQLSTGSRAFAASGESDFPLVATICCALLVIASLFGQWLAPYAKDAVDLGASLVPPFWQPGGSTKHLLGTDQLGRDILSRLIAGARISLATAAAATMISGVFGVIVGLIAGYVGGFVEAVAMRIVDAFLSLPFILLALALVATLGSGFGNIIMVMVIANWARYARLVRSEVISIKERDYVTLARIAGVRPVRIMLRHVLPNALNSVVGAGDPRRRPRDHPGILAVVPRGRHPAAGRVLGPDAGGRPHLPGLRLVADHLARSDHRVRGAELQRTRALARGSGSIRAGIDDAAGPGPRPQR